MGTVTAYWYEEDYCILFEGDDCNTAYWDQDGYCIPQNKRTIVKRRAVFLAQKEVIHERVCCALSLVRHGLPILGGHVFMSKEGASCD